MTGVLSSGAPDSLLSVLYTSTASAPFDDDALGELLDASRDANARADITGMLLYRAGRFVQVLEGRRRDVLDLLERIRADDRHRDVRVLVDEPIDDRQFADWSMGYEPIEPSAAPLAPGFRDTFDDLDERADATATSRAARELSMWFRVRSGRSARAPEGARR